MKLSSLILRCFIAPLLLLLVYGCRKADIPVSSPPYLIDEKLYQLAPGSSESLRKIVGRIRMQDSLHQFMPRLTARYGKPIWNAAITTAASDEPANAVRSIGNSPLESSSSTQAGTSIYIIPFAKSQGGEVLAYLFATASDTTYNFKFYKKRKIEYTDPQKVADSTALVTQLAVFGYFEQTLNNKTGLQLDVLHDSLKLSDINVSIQSGLHHNQGAVQVQQNTQNGLRLSGDEYISYEVYVCFKGACPAMASPDQNSHPSHSSSITPSSDGGCVYCFTYEAGYWNTTGGGGTSSGGSGTGGADGGGGGSGTGGYSYDTYTCPPTDWWCETGDYEIINGNLYTPENFPAMDYGLPWQWWHNGYQNYIEKLPYLFSQLDVNNRWAMAIYRSQLVTKEIINYLEADEYEPESVAAAALTLKAALGNVQNGPYDQYHYDIIQAGFNPTVIGIDATLYWINFKYQVAILRSENPTWGNLRIYYEASKEMVHLMLDGAGMIPVIGEVFDLANGALYTIDGDGVNAALSYASMVPVAGWFTTPAKIAKRGLQLADGSKTILRWTKIGSSVSFGSRTQLREVLQLRKGFPLQAHHIIPWALKDHPLIQAAAKAKDPFHMNEFKNGFPLHTSRHSGSHQPYTDKVSLEIEKIAQRLGQNPDPNVVAQEIRALGERIRNAISTQGSAHITQVNF